MYDSGHMPDAVLAPEGIRAACLCGWRSPATWPDTDSGLAECRREARNHLDRHTAAGQLQSM